MEGTAATPRRPRDPNNRKTPKPPKRDSGERPGSQNSPVKRKRENSDDVEAVDRVKVEEAMRSATIAPEAVMSGGLGLGLSTPDIDLSGSPNIKAEDSLRHHGQYHQPQTLSQTQSPPPSPSPNNSFGAHHLTSHPQYSNPTSHPDSHSRDFGHSGEFDDLITSFGNDSMYHMPEQGFGMGLGSFESSFGMSGEWSSQEVVTDSLIAGRTGEGSSTGEGGIKREHRWQGY
jgi:hypothetical protein